jgi:hypothetical protein
MKGYVYITSSGYDPEKGKDLKDPYLGPISTLGACMPNIRRQVVEGDHIFVISGRIPTAPQYIIAGFEVAEKIDALAAYARFPDLRLHQTADGLVRGNIIVTPEGTQHPLDTHAAATFANRIKNYVVGRNPIALRMPEEIARGRKETAAALRRVMHKRGAAPIDIIGRWSKLEEEQVIELNRWLLSIKNETPRP